MISIRKATKTDVPRIMQIYDGARRFMRQSGNLTQWTGGYPSASTIENDIRAGYLHAGCDEEGILRFVFSMIGGEDPTYAVIDGEWPDNLPYATLHRVASDGTLRRVLDQCVEYALERYDRLRIDTHSDNRPMLDAIARCGFVRRGIIYLADGSPRVAFSRGREE